MCDTTIGQFPLPLVVGGASVAGERSAQRKGSGNFTLYRPSRSAAMIEFVPRRRREPGSTYRSFSHDQYPNGLNKAPELCAHGQPRCAHL